MGCSQQASASNFRLEGLLPLPATLQEALRYFHRAGLKCQNSFKKILQALQGMVPTCEFLEASANNLQGCFLNFRGADNKVHL